LLAISDQEEQQSSKKNKKKESAGGVAALWRALGTEGGTASPPTPSVPSAVFPKDSVYIQEVGIII